MKIKKSLLATVAGLGLFLVSVIAIGSRIATGAERPDQLRPRDWKRALLETKDALGDKNLGMLAAGIAYYGSLAFFPLMAAVVAIMAFVMSPADIRNMAETIGGYIPTEMARLVTQQLTNQTAAGSANLLAALIAIGLSLYGVAGAIENLIKGLNVAYEVEETRNMIMLKVTSLLLTVAGIIGGFCIMALLAINEHVLGVTGISSGAASVLLWVRWPLILGVVTIVLAGLYRYAPNRPRAHWQWVSWGAVMATLIWMIATVLFFFYVQHFSKYTQSYGVFASIVILMTWLNFSALSALIGATVNKRLETRTIQSKVFSKGFRR